jgi:hypothetical protein
MLSNLKDLSSKEKEEEEEEVGAGRRGQRRMTHNKEKREMLHFQICSSNDVSQSYVIYYFGKYVTIS